MVTAATGGLNVKVWAFNGHALTPTGTVLASDGFRSLAFSADGKILAVPVQYGVDLWDTSSWTLITTLLGSSNFFLGAQFTPDQTHLIAIDYDATATPETGSVYSRLPQPLPRFPSPSSPGGAAEGAGGGIQGG